MADTQNTQKKEFILLNIAGYDAKKQTVYGVNVETGKTISIIKDHSQKQQFIRNLATEGHTLFAPRGSTVAFYGLSENPSRPDTYRAEWATMVSKNQVDEIVIAAPVTVSPVINLPHGKTQVKIRILDETPLHVDNINEIADVAFVAVETPTELSGIRGCIVRTGKVGSDEAYTENIRIDHSKPLTEQINAHVNNERFSEFNNVAQNNLAEHGGYIEVIGYTDAINANYNDPKNDTKRSKTPNFINDAPRGGPTFSYAVVVFNKQYKNITQVVPLPALNQIKSVVGLVGSHSKVKAEKLPYLVPKEISEVVTSNVKVPPQYTVKKPLDVRKKLNEKGQFTSVQVTIDPSRIDELEHRLDGLSADKPYVVSSKPEDKNKFKGFYFKKEYLDHVSSMLSDIAGTPAIYTYEKDGQLMILGRTDQEPFNSALKNITATLNGVEDTTSAFSFPLNEKDNVIAQMGDLLTTSALIPATVTTSPKVIEEKLKQTSTNKVSFAEWHDIRYGNQSKGIGDDQNSVISSAAETMGINWEETKHNINWPAIGEKTTHGKNNAIPIDSKHTVYVNVSYDKSYGYDTPGLSINLQNMDTHRGEGFTLQLTQDTYELYEQLVKNENYIPKPSQTAAEVAAHQEAINQNNIRKFAKINAYKAANRKEAFNYSISLADLRSHKILDSKKIPEAIQMLGMKESFNVKHPNIKAALFDVYDIHGDYAGYQEIFEETIVIGKDKRTGADKLGNKLFNVGLSKQTAEGIPIGTHRVVGEISQEPHTILYAEGYANAISNTLATGHPSVICLDVGNIKNVIGLMKKKYPNHTHIQVADNDIASIRKGNIGMLSALDNSYYLDVSIIKPNTSEINSNEKISDTSDIYVHLGSKTLADNLSVIQQPPSEEFAYHAERLLYVSDQTLERQLTLTLKELEQEDGEMENSSLIVLAGELLSSRNAAYIDSATFESSVTPEMLTVQYIDKLRSKYKGVSNPVYDDVTEPPTADKLVVNHVSIPNKTILQRTANSQIENKVSPYPVSVITVNEPQSGKHVARISSPDGSYNDAIVNLLRSNDIPFHRNPDGRTFTSEVKYSNLINSSLAQLTGAPELYTTRLKTKTGGTDPVVVRGNFGDKALRQKMEMVSGKKYDDKNLGFVFESVNDYIFVKEALKHHFTTQNPEISEIEAIRLSEENVDLRAGIYKIADLFNKPSSAIAQSQVYMRIHNPRLAAFQSPLLAALYGQTREAVRGMENFSTLDENRKLDASMHQLKREILLFMGNHPEMAEKYSPHLSGALSIIESQQEIELVPEMVQVKQEAVVVEQEAVVVEQEVVVEQALQLRIANYIEVPSETTELVIEEIEIAEEIARVEAEATEEVAFSPQEVHIAEDARTVDHTVVLVSEVEEEVEYRLTSLYENIRIYVGAKFNEYEFEQALKEPGSSHYEIANGFNLQLFKYDVAQIARSSLAKEFGKLEGLSVKDVYLAVKNKLINDRLKWMKAIFNKALISDPNYNPYGIASKFSQKNVYGLLNPYVDGYNKGDVVTNGKKLAAYDREMLADDLLTIDGQVDITTAAGYFKVIQAEYQRNNGFDKTEDEIDNSVGTDLVDHMRYVSPVTEGGISYLIIDEIRGNEVTSSLVIENKDGAENEEVKNARFEVLAHEEFTNNSGLFEVRSIAIGKERIYQSLLIDHDRNNKKNAFPSIVPDAIEIVNRWVSSSTHEIEVTEPVNEAKETGIITQNHIPEVTPAQINETKATATEDFEALFNEAIEANLSYGDFYSEVFNPSGTLFLRNPYVVDGELDKIAVRNGLKEAGYKSPKSMFDGLALKLLEEQGDNENLSFRDTGLISEYDPNRQLSETYSKIDELLSESGVVSPELSREIISASALNWVANPISSIVVHEILNEDLSQVSASYLKGAYSSDAIKLLMDVNSVNSDEFNDVNVLLTQHNSINSVIRMGFDGFMELDLQTKEEIAKEIGVSRIVGSPKDIAQAVFARINDVQELSVLRNTQYSFIKAAVTVERSGGKIPTSAVRQLNRLLNNETLYRPVILQTIYQAELNKVEQTLKNGYAHLKRLDTTLLERAVEKSTNDEELILRTAMAKAQLGDGTSEREALDFTTFEYKYFTGSNNAGNLDITLDYYVQDSAEIIRTNEPLAYSDMVNERIYPANPSAYAALFSDSSDFTKTNASVLTNEDGDVITIHLSNNSYIVSQLGNHEDAKPLISSEHETYDAALTAVFTDITPTDYIFDYIAKENVIVNILNNNGISQAAVNSIISVLAIDNTKSRELAQEIIGKAKELGLRVEDTTDINLDAQHLVESIYLYAEYNAIADIVRLKGVSESVELSFLQAVVQDIEVQPIVEVEPKNEIESALEALLSSMSNDELLDVQASQAVNQGVTLLQPSDLAEIEDLVSALEETFEVPKEKVEDSFNIEEPTDNDLSTINNLLLENDNVQLPEEAIELLVDTQINKTLKDIEAAALALNNEPLDDFSIIESGDVIIGRVNGDVTYGFVTPEKNVLPYRYQDVDIRNYPSKMVIKGFNDHGTIIDAPLFAFSYEEILYELQSSSSELFTPSASDIAKFITESAYKSGEIDNEIRSILTEPADLLSMTVAKYVDLFKTLSELPEEPLLLTDDEAMAISLVTGEQDLESALQWLALQRDLIRGALATHLFEGAQEIEMKTFGVKGVSTNSHNHIDNLAVNDIEDVATIDPVEIRAKLTGNVTLDKLISDISEPSPIQAMLTELVVSPDNITLVEDIIESGFVNTQGTAIENNQWLALPLPTETLSAPMTSEQVTASTKGEKIYSRSDEVLFVSLSGDLDFGLVLKDTYEVDDKIIITDQEGRVIDTVNTTNISANIDNIHKLAALELEAYTKGQTLFIGDAIELDTLLGARELTGDELLAVYLAKNKFNNEMRYDIDLLSIPDGYEVILDDKEYALSLNDDPKAIEQVGKHNELAGLRKAILVAKSSNIFEKEIKNENNRSESTRSASISAPETLLPSETNSTDRKSGVGVIPEENPSGSSGNNRDGEQPNGRGTTEEETYIVSGEHDTQPLDTTGSNTAGQNISLSNNGIRTGIDFTPNIDFIYDDELIALLTKALPINATYDINIAAIKLSKTITKENRLATNDEKRTLAQYRGWGGAKEIFRGGYQHADKRTELADWLTPEEYESARRSVLSAFYTSPHITKAVWSIVARLGIKRGVGLEPSFGTGNFAATIPTELQSTTALQARELDTLTGEIAGHIHGDLVKTAGFETTNFPSNHFDFSIGNIPFGDYKVYDKNHKNMSSNLIHDYFILKMLDKVKPGGFVPVLTSSGTMDKKSDKVRKEISNDANLVGAIRLPNSAFKDNSGTEALIDILVFQKREPNTVPVNTDWLNVSEIEVPMAFASYSKQNLPMNDYFINNSEMILGNVVAKSSRFGYEIGVMSEEETQYQKAPDIVPLLAAAIEKFPENIYFEYTPKVVAFVPRTQQTDLVKEQASQGKVGSFVINSQGKVAQIELEVTFNTQTLEAEEKLISVELDLPKTKTDRLASLISLKDATIMHLGLMVDSTSTDEDIERSMKALSTQYDNVTKKYKELNSRTNKSIFKSDPEAGVLLSLEHYDRQTKTATKADLFTERTVFPNKVFENIEDPQEAILISLAEYGRIVPEYVMQLTGNQWESITSDLSGTIFENPETSGWDVENAYLSGNVREKLEAAEAAAAIDGKYQINVDYLTKVVPETIPYFEIRAKLGSDWIPPSDIQDFYKFLFKSEDEPCSPSERSDFAVTKINGQWFTDISKSLVSRYHGNTKTSFGTDEWDASRLIEAALNNSPVKVTAIDSDGKRYTLVEQTASALEKLEVVKEAFKTWLWSDENRAVRLEGLYNKLRNSYVEPKFDGSKIQFNGLSPYLAGQEFDPRMNQKNGVMRYLTTGKALYIHDVGVGKSFTLLASIMKGHEVGRHTKPVLTVPKSVFPQMQTLALGHYPNAKILMLDAVKTSDRKEKAVIINKIAMNNWDIIILPHTVLPKIDVPMEFKLQLIDEELEMLERSLAMLNDEGFVAKSSLTSMQSRLEKEKAALERALDENSTYDTLNIAELGIDAIFVDEADEFVNLKKISRLNNIKGVGSAQSNRATALHRITEYLHREVEDAGVVLATGTDIRNNMADLYTLMRFADPSLLEANGVMLFDDFVGSFGDIQTQFEIAPEGSGYIEVTRLNKFINIPELLMMYRQVADVVTAEQAGVVRPKIEEIHVKGEQCEYLEAYMGVLAHRAERSRNGLPVTDNDNLLAITGGGRKSSLSMNLIDPEIPYNTQSKVAQCIDNVSQVYKDNLAMNPSQIIFSDLGVPNKDGRFDLYNEMKTKLIERGIPADKIVFARDFNTDIKKQDLQDRMNSGDIAVCIGSTENMGVGKNVQKRLAAIHDLSIPWRYRDMVQRLGRIERFGNLFPNAKRFIYITEDSFDLFIFQKVMQKAEITLQAKLSPRDSVREFVDDVEPKHADIMALGTSNPIIQKAIEVESAIIKLEIAEKSFHKSLVNLRNTKKIASNTLEYATNRVETLSSLIKVVDNHPVVFGDKIMESETDVKAVTQALNKAIKASLEHNNTERTFKVGNIGEADIVISAKFNGRFLATIKHGDHNEEITEGTYLKNVIEEMTYGVSSELNRLKTHGQSTIENQEVKIATLESQNTSTAFPKAEELQNLRTEYREIETQKAQMLNEVVEYVNPMEKFENLMDGLRANNPIEMKPTNNDKDNWEQDVVITLEPVD